MAPESLPSAVCGFVLRENWPESAVEAKRGTLVSDCPAVFRANFEMLLKRCNELQLRAMLRAVEARLGTSAELICDMARSQAIAHYLNNLLTGTGLQAELGLPPKLRPNGTRPPGPVIQPPA